MSYDGVERARRRFGTNGIGSFDRLQEPLRQGTLLILKQQPGGLPVLERQVLGVLVEVIAQEQPVDDDELGQLRLGAGGEERRQPNERPLPFVLLPELVEPIQVLDRANALRCRTGSR